MPVTRRGNNSNPDPNEPPAPTVPDPADDAFDAFDEGIPTTDEESVFTPVIARIVALCGLPVYSTMVKFIEQQEWSELGHVTSIGVNEVKDFHTVRNDGNYDAKPMMIHLRMFKAFLMFYTRKCHELSTTLDEHDVMNFTNTQFKEYVGSPDYHDDLAMAGAPPKPSSLPRGFNANATATDDLTAQEFRKGVRRDKTHYTDLKDDKYFTTWNRGFVATAHMHHTHQVLDEEYVPRTETEIAVFKEQQTFMYAVLEEHLKTDKGKSLVSQFEATRDAQSIYKELKKHALSSTAAQLSGDTLLQYITTTRFPGNWRGTAYGFALHWKEQVMKYEKLELEDFPPKQKLRMLQNAVGDVTELAYVKQISDQDVALGNQPLAYEGYMELLLSACSTYDKKIMLPGKQKRAVYASAISDGGDDYPYADSPNEEHEVFQVDTDINDIMVHATNTSRFGKLKATASGKPKQSNFLPREEWNKLTQDQKDVLIAKRRQERMGHVPLSANRQVNIHEVEDLVNLDDIIEYTSMTHDVTTPDVKEDSREAPSDNALLTFMAGRGSPSSPGDIRTVLATNRTPNMTKPRKVNASDSAPNTVQVGDTTYHLNKGETITFQGHQYSVHMTCIPYFVSQHDVLVMDKALIDRGANGGICGDDMEVLEGSERFVDVFGLAGHKVSQLRIVTAQALIATHKGNIIATFHQMALLGKGKSILSCLQMEAFGADINDRPRSLSGGKQRILMDGYQIPLQFKNGLAYLPCRKPTADEIGLLPHVVMTSDVDWDPSLYDNVIEDMDDFHDPTLDFIDHDNPFNECGEYRHRTVATHTLIEGEEEFFDACTFLDFDDMVDDLLDTLHPDEVNNTYTVSLTTVEHKANFELLRPLFGWAPAETLKKTFEVTTQFARGRVSDTLKQHWRSRFPACNVKRRNEPVATDTVFSDTPAADSGVTAAQIFVGRESLVADVYGLKTDKEFVNTLEDNIRERGAMDKLISDCAKAESSNRVKQILHALCISSWYSEPYHQNQTLLKIDMQRSRPLRIAF